MNNIYFSLILYKPKKNPAYVMAQIWLPAQVKHLRLVMHELLKLCYSADHGFNSYIYRGTVCYIQRDGYVTRATDPKSERWYVSEDMGG
jgi:hypothetical protein